MRNYLAAALAMTLSSPAFAAAYSYEFTARLTDEYVDEVYLWNGEEYENVGEISTEELGVPGYFGTNGYEKPFTGRVSFEADEDGNITALHECQLGSKACFRNPWEGAGMGWVTHTDPRDVSVSLIDGIGSESIWFGSKGFDFQSDYSYVLPDLPEERGHFVGSFYDAYFEISRFEATGPVPALPDEPAPVPLPAGPLLLASGLGGLALLRRKRTR